MSRLAGQHVFVTGAGRGIGAAIARRVAAEGAVVTCADIEGSSASATAESVTRAGGRATAVTADVTQLDQVEHAVREAEAALGQVTVLVANAGGAAGEGTPFLDLTPEQWHTMIDRNLTGAFICGLVFGRLFAGRNGGTIVFVTSFTADIAPIKLVHYSAAKGGVRQLMQGMALELGPLGIRVNAVAPGFIATEGNASTLENPAAAEAITARVPLRRIGRPEDVAATVAHLASPDSGYITGATFGVDGGWPVRT